MLLLCVSAASAMRLLLVRHAQSVNNVAASEERSRAGLGTAEAQERFEYRRVEDPALSPLGERQAELLVRSLLPKGAAATSRKVPLGRRAIVRHRRHALSHPSQTWW